MSNSRFRARLLGGLRVLCTGALLSGAMPVIAAELPPLPEGLAAPSKAAQLPAFNLLTATGGAVRADEFRGKVVIARFWATW